MKKTGVYWVQETAKALWAHDPQRLICFIQFVCY